MIIFMIDINKILELVGVRTALQTCKPGDPPVTVRFPEQTSPFTQNSLINDATVELLSHFLPCGPHHSSINGNALSLLRTHLPSNASENHVQYDFFQNI